jgi:putative intracellular protease/amidase
MTKRILFVLTSHSEKGNTGEKTGAYLSEVSHPYQVLSGSGFSIDFATPKGGTPPWDGVDLTDAVNASFFQSRELADQLARAPQPAQVVAADYQAIFFAGGHGAMWDFPNDRALARLAAAIYEAGGVVGAVCHGPAGLVNVALSNGDYLVAGKAVAAFTNDEERAVKLENVVPFSLVDELSRRGAKHQPGPMWQARVVVSERLVTGQNPASASGVASEMAKLLSS